MTKGTPFYRSLRFKLVVSVLLVVLVSMTVLSVMLLTAIRAELLNQMIVRAGLLARSVGRTIQLQRDIRPVGAPERGGDTLNQVLNSFAGEEHVAGLALFDGEGRELSRAGQAFDPPREGWRQRIGGERWLLVPEAGGGLLVSAPLLGLDRPARLAMLFSLEAVNRAIAISQLKAVFQISASAALILVFLVIILTLAVITPLQGLSRGIERISAGNLGHPVELASRDEMGFLAESLNAMMATLRENRETIERQFEALKAAHRETIEAQTRLIAAEKMASLGTLAAGVAHEVGNPLGAVIGYINLLIKGGMREEERRECMQRTSAELSRIHRIMLELLNYARPTAEDSSPLEVNFIIRSLVDNLRREGVLGGLEITLELTEDLPRPTGFPHKLEQVFTNLIDNAVWATAPKGNLVIRTGAVPGGAGGWRGELRLTFTDDGCGIPEGDRERIFDPFFTTRLGHGGTGLGLAITRRIVEEMGGSIRVESRPGETSFVIGLPVW